MSGPEDTIREANRHLRNMPGRGNFAHAEASDAALAALTAERDELREQLEVRPFIGGASLINERAEAAERENAELREALRLFVPETYDWKFGGQVTPWISREQWDAARAALSREPAAAKTPRCTGYCVGIASAHTLVEDLTCPVHGIDAQAAAEKVFPDRQAWLDAVPGGVQTPEERDE